MLIRFMCVQMAVCDADPVKRRKERKMGEGGGQLVSEQNKREDTQTNTNRQTSSGTPKHIVISVSSLCLYTTHTHSPSPCQPCPPPAPPLPHLFPSFSL